MLPSEVSNEFVNLFSEYIQTSDDALLEKISEISKELVRSGVPIEEIGRLFGESLSAFSVAYPDTRVSEVADRMSVLLVNLLTAYKKEMNRCQFAGNIYVASKMMEASADGMWIADDQGNILMVNAAFSRITGYEPSEIVGQHMRIIHGGANDDIVMDKLWTMVRNHGIWKGELISRRKNGQMYPALWSLSIIYNENKQIHNYIGVLTDISHRHREQNLRRELERAAEIYNLMVLPRLPEMSGIEINVKCIPAENIGGDTMEIVKIDPKKLILFIADITGHGISSAMTANTLKVLFREISEITVEPSRIFNYINSVMYNHILPDDMITAFCGRIDLETMDITYCLNGLPNPLIYRNGQFIRLQPTGYPLGVFEHQDTPSITIPIQYGDIFVAFTDGIVEARAENGDIFGIAGIENSIGNRPHTVHTIIDDLIHHAVRFQNRETFSDDIIVAAISFYDERIVTYEVSRSNTYSFPTKSVCKGKIKFLFIDEVVSFFINDLAKKTGLTLEDFGGIRIALFELILNAIEHGNLEMTEYKRDIECYDSERYWEIFHERMESEEYGNRQITIECQIQADQIEITIEDGGRGFDVNAIQHPDLNNLLKPSGRGIALAKMNVDKLMYNAKGNKVTVYKKL